jgi:hypothetical protein
VAEMRHTGSFLDGVESDPEIALIADHWQFIAAVAWTRYLSDGRGAVVIDEEAQASGLMWVKYLVGPVWPGHEVLVETYDPRSEVLVVFIHTEGGWNLHRVETALLPPDAAAMHPAER